MRPARSLLLAASLLATVAAAACSSSTSLLPTGISDPDGAQSFAGLAPSALPIDCFAGSYYVWTSGGPCHGTTYLLCDGRTWNQYVCSDPFTLDNPWIVFNPAAGGGDCTEDDECVGGLGCDLTTQTCLPPLEFGCDASFCCSSDLDCGSDGSCDLDTNTCN
jgi:hypothetical protein